MKLSSLLEGLWSPKLDRYNSWERSPGDTLPQELVASSRVGHVTLKNTYSSAYLYEYLRYKYLSKPRDQVVMMGRSAPPAVLCFRGIPAVQFCLPNEASPEWRYLQYCFIKPVLQSDTVLYLSRFKFYSICVMSICKQKSLYNVNEICQAKTNQHLFLFRIHTPLFLIPSRGELHEYLFLGLY